LVQSGPPQPSVFFCDLGTASEIVPEVRGGFAILREPLSQDQARLQSRLGVEKCQEKFFPFWNPRMARMQDEIEIRLRNSKPWRYLWFNVEEKS
jgi:hypothetical protein